LPPTLIAFGRCTITSRPLQALRFELPVQAGAPIFRARAFPHRKFASVLEGGCLDSFEPLRCRRLSLGHGEEGRLSRRLLRFRRCVARARRRYRPLRFAAKAAGGFFSTAAPVSAGRNLCVFCNDPGFFRIGHSAGRIFCCHVTQ